MSSGSSNATRNATSSCAGARKHLIISASCHRVREFAIRSISNIWPGTVWSEDDQNGAKIAYPDTLVGTDSHTTMVNGLAVLGWGVGGIEAEAAMLGQPVSMLIPEVIGMRLTGRLPEGATATDLVLMVTERLRAPRCGRQVRRILRPRARRPFIGQPGTLSNMAPEYGATCGFCPIDTETLRYLRFTGRDEANIQLVEAYAKAQGMWRAPDAPDPQFTDLLEFDLGGVEPSLAGPKRPQDRVALSNVETSYTAAETEMLGAPSGAARARDVEGGDYRLTDGNVVIAAITSCTNTSNPDVMLAAGLVAKKALAKGVGGQTLGQDLACPRQPSGRRLSRGRRPAKRSE